MNIADPTYLEHLRDLPTSYLLDLLADNEEIDAAAILWVLEERGLTREEVERKRQRRRHTPWMRPYRFWAVARWLTLFNTLIVAYFNIIGLYGLLHSDHPFRGPLLFLAVGSIVAGFITGFKMTTHVYHGSRFLLYCGFPFPVGHVDLRTGEEIQPRQAIMNLRMAVNALTGVNVTLFPLIFIYIILG